MNTQYMARKLVEAGYTQTKIVDMIHARGAKCTQPTLCRMLKGAEPSYTLGKAVENIYREVFEQSNAA